MTAENSKDKKTLKVLIVSVGQISGGIERYTLTLGKKLENSGYEVHYALRANSWLDSEIVTEKKVRVEMGRHLILDMMTLKQYVKENNIPIIHCNSNNSLFVSLLIQEDNDHKKIGVIHGDVLADQQHKGRFIANVYSKLEKWLVNKHCSYCIAVSNSIKNILIERGVKENKIDVVYTGIESLTYSALPDYYNNVLNICSVGNLIPIKNHRKLLEALYDLKKEYPEIQVKCDIYGEGIERESLENYIEEHDMKYVSLKGYDVNVRSKLNEYALYIHPSKYESFGISILEAMNAGCCIIANNVGGMTEILDERSGYLIDAEDSRNIEKAIIRLYDDREVMKQYAINGKYRVEEMFTTDEMLRKTIEIYNR